jgi:hypothetical protein
MRRRISAGVATVVAVATIGIAGLAAAGPDDDGREPRGRARACGLATLRGAYGIHLQGSRPSGPGGPMEVVTGVVLRVYDGRGHFTQRDNVKGSVTGIVPDRPGAGTYEVDENCTGITRFDPGNGVVIEERLVIVDDGRTVHSIVASPQPVMMTAEHTRVGSR